MKIQKKKENDSSYRFLVGPGSEAFPSGSTLSNLSSYGEDTFSLESLQKDPFLMTLVDKTWYTHLRRSVVTLLAKLDLKLKNEILTVFR